MTQVVRCPQCGEAFPAGLEPREYEGICPRCLALMAMDTREDVALSSAGTEPRPAPEPPPLKRGATFRGLEVLELIGQGGMGVVYKARQIELDRVVALKVLSPRLAADEEFSRRFHREAQALASLDHPHIVRVHDVGREGDLYFLVMEYVDGVNLRDLMVQKKIAPEQALGVVPQLCDALEYAHSRGVIHRDIKPENIILDRSGNAKIADFGLAKIVKDERASVAITQTNLVMGTAEYMAPEQREGLKEVDHRADIYSLGVVLYELLTGELPVGRFDLPSRRVRVDVRIDDVVLKALEKNPELRYQRASQLGKDVGQVVVSGPAPAPDCPIVELASGRRLGTAAGRRLAVRTVACPLVVAGWDRDEIGLRVEGDYQIDMAGSTPLLQSQVETASVHVSVPRGVDLDLVAAEGRVALSGVCGHASAKLPEGDLAVERYEGSLRAVVGQGRVTIEGLKSEYFEVRARAGKVSIRGLELSRGRGQVETEEGAVEIAPSPGCSFRYYFQSASGKIEGPAAGQVGAGGASLTVRTGSGGIALTPPPAAALSLWDFVRQLTPKQVEKLGVYVIVNLGLFIFFLAVAGTAIPAVCVAVPWGIVLALEFWKGYVRRAEIDGSRLSDAMKKLARWVPTPEPEPAPPAPKTRVSLLASIGCFVGILSALAAGGAVVAAAVVDGDVAPDLSEREADAVRLAALVCSLASFVTAVFGFILGMTASSHIGEARGYLKGKTATHLAVAFPVLSFFVLVGYIGPRVKAVRDAAGEAQEGARQFLDAVRARDYERAADLLGAELRKSMSAGDLRKEVESRARGDAWSGLRLEGIQLRPRRDAAEVGLRGPYARTEWLLMVREGRWKVGRLKEFLKALEN